MGWACLVHNVQVGPTIKKVIVSPEGFFSLSAGRICISVQYHPVTSPETTSSCSWMYSHFTIFLKHTLTKYFAVWIKTYKK